MNFLHINNFKKKIKTKFINTLLLNYYKCKFLYAKVKCLYYLKIITKIQKKHLLNVIMNNNYKIIFYKKIHNSIFYNINEKTILKLFLIDEIKKIHILICFIRKILISYSELEYSTIINDYNNKFTTFGQILLSWNELLKNDHNFLLHCFNLSNVLTYNVDNYVKKYKNLFLNIIKNLLNFEKTNENILNLNFDCFFFFMFFLNSISLHLNIIFKKIDFLILNYKNNFFNVFNFKKKIILLKINSIKIYNNLNNLILNSFENFFLIKNIIIESTFLIKKNLNNFRKILSSFKLNKKKIYLYNLKKNKILYKIKNYLIKKNVKLKNCKQIIKEIYFYIKKRKINFYNITLKELKNINKNFENDIFYKVSIEYYLKKQNFYGGNNISQILKSIQRAKFFLNKILLKFKI